jgi:hypothetical protein
VPFSAEHLICRYVQTDRQTDELIRVGLGNLFGSRYISLAARGLEEHVRITLIFSRIISFMLFTVLLSHMYFFRRISDSQFTL